MLAVTCHLADERGSFWLVKITPVLASGWLYTPVIYRGVHTALRHIVGGSLSPVTTPVLGV